MDELLEHYGQMDFALYLKRHSWLTVEAHEDFARESYEKQFRAQYGGPVNDAILDLFSPYMAIKRMIWGRAVQPLGNLDDIAPLVGAARLVGDQAAPAQARLGELLISAFRHGNKHMIKKIKSLCEIELGDHRNYQVWIAIGEVLDSGEYKPSKLLTLKLKANGFPDPTPARWFPSTTEVKAWVNRPENLNAARFGNLPKDDKGWSRLWVQSGADCFIEPGIRGKNTLAK